MVVKYTKWKADFSNLPLLAGGERSIEAEIFYQWFRQVLTLLGDQFFKKKKIIRFVGKLILAKSYKRIYNFSSETKKQ